MINIQKMQNQRIIFVCYPTQCCLLYIIYAHLCSLTLQKTYLRYNVDR